MILLLNIHHCGTLPVNVVRLLCSMLCHCRLCQVSTQDTQEGRDIARRTSRWFLMARITQNVRIIRELEHDLFFQRRQLEFNLRQPHVSALEVARAKVHEKTTDECKERQKRKFDCMMRRAAEGTRPRRPDNRWIVNVSSRTLSAAEKEVLARGLNFAPAPKRVPVTEIVTAVEDGQNTFKNIFILHIGNLQNISDSLRNEIH